MCADAVTTGLSGLKSQGKAIANNAANIANVDAPGYKSNNSYFSTLIPSGVSKTSSAGGGVQLTSHRLVTREGEFQQTGEVSDLTVRQGNGMFVVNSKKDGTGDIVFTRAGSFEKDSEDNYVTKTGHVLMAWPLDGEGRLPGQAGNINTTSNALIDSLKPVNIKSVSGAASGTTKVDFAINLKATEEVLEGSGQTIVFPTTSVNDSLGKMDVIAPNGNLQENYDIVVQTTTPNTYIFTYGGVEASNDITVPGGILGALNENDVFKASGGAVEGDGFSITTPKAGTVTFTFKANGPSLGGREFNTLNTLAQAISLAGGLTARVKNGVLYVAPTDANEGMTIANTGSGGTNFATQLGLTSTLPSGGGAQRFATLNNLAELVNQTSELKAKLSDSITDTQLKIYTKDPTETLQYGQRIWSQTNTVPPAVFGATTTTTDFANAGSFTIDVTNPADAAGGYTFTYNAAPDPTLGQFSTMADLVTAINTFADGILTASLVGDRIQVKAVTMNQGLRFTDQVSTYVASLGFDDVDPPTPSTNYDRTRSVASTILGVNTMAAAFTTPTDGDVFTMTIQPAGTVHTFTFRTAAPNAALGEFNSMNNLITAINTVAAADVTASVQGATRIQVMLNDEDEGLTFAGNAALLTGLGFNNVNTTATTNHLLREFGLNTTPTTAAYDPIGGILPNMANGRVTPQFTRNLEIYDTLGIRHDFKVSFVKLGDQRWATEIYAINPSELISTRTDGLIASGEIIFNGNGSLRSVSTPLISPMRLQWTNGALESNILMNWGTAGEPEGTAGVTRPGLMDGMRQLATPYDVKFIKQNGVAAELLKSIDFDKQGYVVANFKNGLQRKLFKIPLADFPNPNGLTAMDGNVFAANIEAGDFNLREPDTGNVGYIQGGGLEKSNVDLADELTRMVVAQRGYEASAQVITVGNQILQKLIQLFG